jgi:8-oxo-dGTP diphosphatase
MNKLERPVLSVDVVMLAAMASRLWILLPRRAEQPFKAARALPGVGVLLDETLMAAAKRALITKGALSEQLCEDSHLEQLASYDALYRDPRGRTVSVAYLGLIRGQSRLSDAWIAAHQVAQGTLPFDHSQIVADALSRLRGKIRYTNIAAKLLPDTFRIDELQEVYEAILGRPLNRANFRTKLLKIGCIERVGVLEGAVGSQGGRPPHLYRFTAEDVEASDRDFL